MNRRLLTVMLLVLCACSDPEPDTTGAERVYRHAMDGAPGSLDPAHANSVYAKFLTVNLYDTLYRYKYLARPYEVTPNLAQALPDISEDGLVYTIRLKEGVRFIDDPAFGNGGGREVTASDFIYSLKRHFDPATRSRGAWLWQGRIVGLDAWKDSGSDYDAEVPGLKSLDRYTVRIELTSPFPQLVHTLAQGLSAVVPREAVERYGGEFANHPVGSGPFMLQSVDNARAVFLRNPDFRREPFSLAGEGFDPATQGHLGLEALEGMAPPLLDRLQIDFIAEDAARWNAYISGDVQFIKVPVTQFSQVLASHDPVAASPDFQDHHVELSLESGFVYTNFNLDDDRIGYHPDEARNARNHALRCAIRGAFDWHSRNEVFFSGLGRVFPGVIPPSVPEFDPDQGSGSIRFDLESARRSLADNGWTPENLPVLEYGFPSTVTERQMFEQFRSFMVDLGWPQEKVKPLTYATFGDYFRAYSNREVMLITSSWTMDFPDAENTVQLYFGPNGSPGSNSSNYNNPEYDALYRRGAVMQPSAERTELYRQMNEMVIRDCAAISGISRNLLFLWRKNAVMLPDRSFVGGFYLRFVDVIQPGQGDG